MLRHRSSSHQNNRSIISGKSSINHKKEKIKDEFNDNASIKSYVTDSTESEPVKFQNPYPSSTIVNEELVLPSGEMGPSQGTLKSGISLAEARANHGRIDSNYDNVDGLEGPLNVENYLYPNDEEDHQTIHTINDVSHQEMVNEHRKQVAKSIIRKEDPETKSQILETATEIGHSLSLINYPKEILFENRSVHSNDILEMEETLNRQGTRSYKEQELLEAFRAQKKNQENARARAKAKELKNDLESESFSGTYQERGRSNQKKKSKMSRGRSLEKLVNRISEFKPKTSSTRAKSVGREDNISLTSQKMTLPVNKKDKPLKIDQIDRESRDSKTSRTRSKMRSKSPAPVKIVQDIAPVLKKGFNKAAKEAEKLSSCSGCKRRRGRRYPIQDQERQNKLNGSKLQIDTKPREKSSPSTPPTLQRSLSKSSKKKEEDFRRGKKADIQHRLFDGTKYDEEQEIDFEFSNENGEKLQTTEAKDKGASIYLTQTIEGRTSRCTSEIYVDATIQEPDKKPVVKVKQVFTIEDHNDKQDSNQTTTEEYFDVDRKNQQLLAITDPSSGERRGSNSEQWADGWSANPTIDRKIDFQRALQQINQAKITEVKEFDESKFKASLDVSPRIDNVEKENLYEDPTMLDLDADHDNFTFVTRQAKSDNNVTLERIKVYGTENDHPVVNKTDSNFSILTDPFDMNGNSLEKNKKEGSNPVQFEEPNDQIDKSIEEKTAGYSDPDDICNRIKEFEAQNNEKIEQDQSVSYSEATIREKSESPKSHSKITSVSCYSSDEEETYKSFKTDIDKSSTVKHSGSPPELTIQIPSSCPPRNKNTSNGTGMYSITEVTEEELQDYNNTTLETQSPHSPKSPIINYKSLIKAWDIKEDKEENIDNTSELSYNHQQTMVRRRQYSENTCSPASTLSRPSSITKQPLKMASSSDSKYDESVSTYHKSVTSAQYSVKTEDFMSEDSTARYSQDFSEVGGSNIYAVPKLTKNMARPISGYSTYSEEPITASETITATTVHVNTKNSKPYCLTEITREMDESLMTLSNLDDDLMSEEILPIPKPRSSLNTDRRSFQLPVTEIDTIRKLSHSSYDANTIRRVTKPAIEKKSSLKSLDGRKDRLKLRVSIDETPQVKTYDIHHNNDTNVIPNNETSPLEKYSVITSNQLKSKIPVYRAQSHSAPNEDYQETERSKKEEPIPLPRSNSIPINIHGQNLITLPNNTKKGVLRELVREQKHKSQLRKSKSVAGHERYPALTHVNRKGVVPEKVRYYETKLSIANPNLLRRANSAHCAKTPRKSRCHDISKYCSTMSDGTNLTEVTPNTNIQIVSTEDLEHFDRETLLNDFHSTKDLAHVEDLNAYEHGDNEKDTCQDLSRTVSKVSSGKEVKYKLENTVISEESAFIYGQQLPHQNQDLKSLHSYQTGQSAKASDTYSCHSSRTAQTNMTSKTNITSICDLELTKIVSIEPDAANDKEPGNSKTFFDSETGRLQLVPTPKPRKRGNKKKINKSKADHMINNMLAQGDSSCNMVPMGLQDSTTCAYRNNDHNNEITNYRPKSIVSSLDDELREMNSKPKAGTYYDKDTGRLRLIPKKKKSLGISTPCLDSLETPAEQSLGLGLVPEPDIMNRLQIPSFTHLKERVEECKIDDGVRDDVSLQSVETVESKATIKSRNNREKRMKKKKKARDTSQCTSHNTTTQPFPKTNERRKQRNHGLKTDNNPSSKADTEFRQRSTSNLLPISNTSQILPPLAIIRASQESLNATDHNYYKTDRDKLESDTKSYKSVSTAVSSTTSRWSVRKSKITRKFSKSSEAHAPIISQPLRDMPRTKSLDPNSYLSIADANEKYIKERNAAVASKDLKDIPENMEKPSPMDRTKSLDVNSYKTGMPNQSMFKLKLAKTTKNKIIHPFAANKSTQKSNERANEKIKQQEQEAPLGPTTAAIDDRYVNHKTCDYRIKHARSIESFKTIKDWCEHDPIQKEYYAEESSGESGE